MRRILFLLFLVPGLRASAQDIRCSASVEATVIEEGRSFTLTVSVTGNDLGDVAAPTLPAMNGLETVYPNAGTSTSLQIINGRRSETKSFQYVLRARKVGRWQVPSITIAYRGTHCATQPLALEVVPLGKLSGTASPANEAFLAVIPYKREAYVGEQILVLVKIYTRVSISQYSPDKMPNFTGFWVEDFPLRQPLEAERENLNGVAYSTFTIKRSAIFPTRAGDLTIDPAEVECELRIPRKSQGGFDDFFSPFSDPFGQTVVKRFQSDPVVITVKELPSEGKPADFTGLVGQFNVTASVDKNRIKTGEALVYKVEISGTGNLTSAEAPPNPFPDDFEKYEPKVQTDISRNGTVIGGRRVFEYVVIPRSARTFEVPPMNLSYFDPAAKKYVTRTATAQTITIDQGADQFAGSGPLSKSEVALISTDIRYLKSDALDRAGAAWYRHAWSVLLWLLPVGLWIGGEVLHRWRMGPNAHTAERASKRASPMARRRLKAAEKLMAEKQVDTFYSEIARTVTGLIADKLRVPEAALIRDDVVRRLRERNLDETLIQEYIACMDVCDEARFSPDRATAMAMEAVYEKVKSAIRNMDKAL